MREIELLAPAQVTVLAERRRFRPWGLAGGGEGAAGRAVVVKGTTGESVELAAKCSVHVEAGDVLRMETPGGGGMGSDK